MRILLPYSRISEDNEYLGATMRKIRILIPYSRISEENKDLVTLHAAGSLRATKILLDCSRISEVNEDYIFVQQNYRDNEYFGTLQ